MRSKWQPLIRYLRSGIKDVVRRALNRRSLRWPSALAATPLVSWKARSPYLVTPVGDGLFAHRYREGTVVYPTLRGRHPAALAADTLDFYCYLYTPRPGDVVLDIGAGMGEETPTFSRLVAPAGRVIAVEALPSTYTRLVKTVALNRLTNVETVQTAIADTRGTLTMDDGEMGGGYIAASLSSGDIEVPAETVDGLVARFGLDRIDLLKMNIEGAEQLAIRGMEHAVAITRNVVICCHDFIPESNPSADIGWFATFDRVKSHFESAGFEITMRPDDPRPWVRYHVYGQAPQ